MALKDGGRTCSKTRRREEIKIFPAGPVSIMLTDKKNLHGEVFSIRRLFVFVIGRDDAWRSEQALQNANAAFQNASSLQQQVCSSSTHFDSYPLLTCPATDYQFTSENMDE